MTERTLSDEKLASICRKIDDDNVVFQWYKFTPFGAGDYRRLQELIGDRHLITSSAENIVALQQGETLEVALLYIVRDVVSVLKPKKSVRELEMISGDWRGTLERFRVYANGLTREVQSVSFMGFDCDSSVADISKELGVESSDELFLHFGELPVVAPAVFNTQVIFICPLGNADLNAEMDKALSAQRPTRIEIE
jgi:hypothetical protein